jgi:rhamnosyltransferase
MTSEPMISILIRVRDEARALDDVLRRLEEQVIDARAEVVVLDNESVDDSGAVAQRFGARVFSIPRHLFGYGRVLNLGIELCRGEIIVLLSAHAFPGSQDWLGDLVEPLRYDGEVGAVFCRQIPMDDVSRLERQRFGVFPAADYILDRESFVAQCEAGRHPFEVILFSNSACAIKRSIALKFPFRDLPASEDRAFVLDYIMAGGKIAYLQQPWVWYDKPRAWQSYYRLGYSGEVSKRLIQELATSYTDIPSGFRGSTVPRLAHVVLVGPVVVKQLVLALREPPGLRRRTALAALRRTGGTLGAAGGSLRWRRHLRSLSRDETEAQRLRENCREMKTEPTTLPD